jgi:hypothetical protein
MASRMSTVPASSKTSGRQKVHIQIAYRGKGEPGKQLKERCDTLVEMLVDSDAGVIAERKAGNGAVDVYVVTGFADHTVEMARKTANELGISARTTIKILDAAKVDKTKVVG